MMHKASVCLISSTIVQLLTSLNTFATEDRGEVTEFEQELVSYMTQSSDPFPILPEKFLRKHLKKIVFTGRDLHKIPPHFFDSTKLEELNLSDNQLTEKVTKGLSKLSYLKVLHLNTNQFWRFPPEIVKLTNLKRLYLGENYFDSVPPKIVELPNLQILYLSNNRISQLPEGIGKLTNLQELYLGRNMLEEIPSSIGNLKKLSDLRLYGNQLKQLPATIGYLAALRILDLTDNDSLNEQQWAEFVDGKELGEFLSHAQNFVHHIEKCYNDYQLIPIVTSEDDPSQNFTYKLLQLISFSNFDSVTLQQSIFFPKTLTIGGKTCDINEYRLDLRSQDSFPIKMLFLKNLNELIFSSNVVTSIPSWIGQLSNLTFLCLSDCPFQEIPSSIGNLTKLKTAYFPQLRFLPWTIANLLSLERLYLSCNDLNAQHWGKELKGEELKACLEPAHDLTRRFNLYCLLLWIYKNKDNPFTCLPREIINYIPFVDFDAETFKKSVFYRA